MGNQPTTAQLEQVKSTFGKDEFQLLSKMFAGMSARSPGKQSIEKTTFLRYFNFPGMFGERLYQLFDLNKDNFISFDEFMFGISRYLHGSHDDKLKMLFQLYNLSGDGYISPEELQVMLYSLVSTPSLIPQMFERVGGDHPHQRGSSHKPVVASLEDERLMKAMVQSEIKEIFLAHDLDEDGRLSFKDFKHWVKDSPTLFNQLDNAIGKHLWHRPGSKNAKVPAKAIEELQDQIDFNPQCRNCQFQLHFCPLCGHKISPQRPLVCQNKNCKLEVFAVKTAPQYCLHCGVPWGRVTDPEDESKLLDEGDGGDDETKFGHCGILGKKRRIRGFKTKFFVQRGAFLYSFEKQNDTQPKSVTFLDGLFIEIHKSDPWAHKKFFGFDIITPKVAFTQEEADAAERIEEEARSKRGGGPKVINADAESDGEDDAAAPGTNTTSITLYARSTADRILWVRALRRASRTIPFTEHYRLGEIVGQGRFANVHRAIHIRTRKEYAAKVIPKSKLTAHDAELLRREIAILTLLDGHPNILFMKETFENSRSIFIVMPLELGGTALQRLQKVRLFSEKVTRRLIWQILEALEYLHDRGIVHRDIKPENLMLRHPEDDDRIQALLIDFGLSKWARPSEMINVARGTIVYIAPEVILGQGYNNMVDVWGCGVLMYIFLSGRLPFVGNENEVINHILETPVPLNLPIHKHITPEGLDLLRRLMTKDPNRRITLAEVFKHPWFKLDTPQLGPAFQRVEPSLEAAPEKPPQMPRDALGPFAADAALVAAAVSGSSAAPAPPGTFDLYRTSSELPGANAAPRPRSISDAEPEEQAAASAEQPAVATPLRVRTLSEGPGAASHAASPGPGAALAVPLAAVPSGRSLDQAHRPPMYPPPPQSQKQQPPPPPPPQPQPQQQQPQQLARIQGRPPSAPATPAPAAAAAPNRAPTPPPVPQAAANTPASGTPRK